jgi:hypothetical protein
MQGPFAQTAPQGLMQEGKVLVVQSRGLPDMSQVAELRVAGGRSHIVSSGRALILFELMLNERRFWKWETEASNTPCKFMLGRWRSVMCVPCGVVWHVTPGQLQRHAGRG